MNSKRTNPVTIFFVLCIFIHSIASDYSIHGDACRTEMVKAFPPQLFKVDGDLITTKKFVTSVYSENKECMLDVERLLEPYRFENSTVEVGMIFLDCKNFSKILFNLTETETFPNIVGYLYGFNCSFERANLLKFLETLNFFVLLFTGLFVDSFSNQGLNSSVLDKIISLGLVSPKNDTIQTINYLFGRENNYKAMAEIFISDSPVIINLTTLNSQFPNVQSLEITDSKFEALHTFLWTNINGSFLPDNLWRSDYFQDHYSNAFHVEIPGNLVKRSLRLANCNMSDLSQITLKGNLHQIDLASNRIVLIHPETFHSVSGLQSLVLKSNMINHIPEDVFYMQQSMTNLDLSDNQLSNMSSAIFSPLRNLKYLNLAKNLIFSLPEGIFFNLNHLQVLRLDNNSLLSVSPRTLPYFSVKLHSIFLNNNPLKLFPVSCFYIRSLKTIELKNTQITFDDVTSVLRNIDYDLLRQSVVVSASVANQDPTESPDELRKVDLTGSRVKSFHTIAKLSTRLQHIMVILLKHFHFILVDNPLTCDCNTIPLNAFMKNYKISGTWTGNEYFFREWICKHPRQFEGDLLLLLKDEDTYCEISDAFCPLQCKCYKRYNSNVTIVDCFDSGLNEFPMRLPRGIIDLWMNNNNISTMPRREYLNRVRWLDLSNSRLSEIKTSAFNDMPNLRTLNLDNNKLCYLPSSIKHLRLHSFSVTNNRLRCDCHALQTKHWLLSNLNIVENTKSIACLEGKQQSIISTPDKEFVCLSDKKFLNLSILIPTLASVFVLMILILFLCVYRFEIKVLLYIYCGLHPFDKLTGCKNEVIDFTVIYSKENADFVQSNVISCLQHRGYNLLDIHENFLAGYSFQENITSAVQISKHVLVVLSEQMLNNSKLLNIVWSECQSKIEKYRANFIILASHDLKRFKIQNKEVTRYLGRNRCIHTRSALFLDELSYYLPKMKSNLQQNIDVFHSLLNESRCTDRTAQNEYDIFISYTDDYREKYSMTLTFSALENDGYRLCLPDRDFVPGSPMTHNIVDSINKSTHTILVTRDFSDEEQMFVYRTANEKSSRCKYNHLIVLFLDNNDDVSLRDKDIEKYISSYVTLRLSDTNCLARLKCSLSCLPVTNDTEINVSLD